MDNDGISNDYETATGVYVSPTDTGSDPLIPDSDVLEYVCTEGEKVIAR